MPTSTTLPFTPCLVPLGLVALLGLACGDDTNPEVGVGTTGDGGEPISAPRLMSPADGSIDLASSVQLCWSPSFTEPGTSLLYRVLLDGAPIGDGVAAHETTCTEVSQLDWDRTYDWSVEAFHSASPDERVVSETWTFSTDWDPAGKILLEDDFTEDRGWTVFGEATSGRWIWGSPAAVEDGPSRPQACHAESSCWFTQGSVDGTTVLLSPPFDATGASRLAVDLARLFHRESFETSSAAFAVDLLVPDEEAPLGTRAYALERLVNAQDAKEAGAWASASFSACSILFAPSSRLRITVSDHGGELVEAALDDVTVRGFKSTDGCDTGVGAICDPKVEGGCDPGLLCCGQGAIDVGYDRCSEPRRALDLANPPPTPGSPANGPLGCHAPDIVLLEEVAGFPMRMYIDDLYVPPNACSLEERCVDGAGWRRLLRFDTMTANVGSRDLVLGPPGTHPEFFSFSDCHAHYHFEDYARYHLIDGSGRAIRGHKQAFCLMDLVSWAWPQSFESRYHCMDQGISMGWTDIYEAELDCQWIDITDVEPGDYTLHIEVNYPRAKEGTPTLVERDYDNNVLEVGVTIP